MIDIIGVMPEPPANITRCRLFVESISVVKCPVGAITCILLPGLMLSASQFDIFPASTRLTVTAGGSFRYGEEQSEYDRRISLPSTGAISVRNCPDLYSSGEAGCLKTI